MKFAYKALTISIIMLSLSVSSVYAQTPTPIGSPVYITGYSDDLLNAMSDVIRLFYYFAGIVVLYMGIKVAVLLYKR